MLTGDLKYVRPTREYREMAVLGEVARDARVSQRKLARAAGVSATMINAYVDDLVGRGLLDVSGETNRSYRYHLTPEGERRRAGLQRDVLSEVEGLYHRLREACAAPVTGMPEAGGADVTEAA